MTWTIDPAHTAINFSVRHMMISNVHGQFQKFTATLEIDETTPANTRVDLQIDVDSLSTRDASRDAHLKSADFFDIENYPTIYFHSTRVEVKDLNHAALVGDLTIRGISREIELDVEFNGLSRSPWGTSNAGFSARSQLKRNLWGLKWNVPLESGGWLVGEEIQIRIELEMIQEPETASVPVFAPQDAAFSSSLG
jgi:polyisoprenoid-binding protein YceI